MNETSLYKKRASASAKTSSQLSCMSNTQLMQMISNVPKGHTGIGGASVVLTIGGKKIFTKMIPLTDLEKQPDNMYSTRNIFELPLCYQYGVGSTGFGVWRELASHVICSNWVINNLCKNFPILYHYRILPAISDHLDVTSFQSIEKHVSYWESISSIKNRYQEILDAKSMVVLFLEYIPTNLHDWLKKAIHNDIKKAEEISLNFLQQLISTSKYMAEHGMVHFDSHFKNILTDGETIYIADHGLALSSYFSLNESEKEFLDKHKFFDLCFTISNFLHSLTTAILGDNSWEGTLKMIKEGKPLPDLLPPFITKLIKEYGQSTLIMSQFYKNLQNVSKKTPFPSQTLENLLSV